MKTPHVAALVWLAAIWIGFGGLGVLTAMASLMDPVSADPGWQLTAAVSLGLVTAGFGLLQARRWARWLAIAAVSAALSETVIWIVSFWPGTPVLIASALVHVIGLVILIGAWPSQSARADAGGRRGQGVQSSGMSGADSGD